MSTLKFEGVVRLGNPCRTGPDPNVNGAIFIGNSDFVGEVETNFDGNVTVRIGEARFAGDLFVITGWGSDRLRVAGHDIIEILERHEGKRVTVWVSGDLLEDAS